MLDAYGRPLGFNMTHVILNMKSGRFVSQHRSEKAAENGLKLRKGSTSFENFRIVPIGELKGKKP